MRARASSSCSFLRRSPNSIFTRQVDAIGGGGGGANAKVEAVLARSDALMLANWSESDDVSDDEADASDDEADSAPPSFSSKCPVGGYPNLSTKRGRQMMQSDEAAYHCQLT